MRLKRPAIVLVPLLFLFLTCTSSAQAATYTWTGVSMNNNWSNAQNWEGNVAPNRADNSPDTLVFPAGAFQTTMTNDLPNGTSFVRLEFRGSYVLNGNRIVVTDSIATQILLVGTVDINTALTLQGSGGDPIAIHTNLGNTLRLDGAIGGPSTGLLKTGAGTLAIGGAAINTFALSTRVDGGTLLMGKTQAIPGGLIIENGTARYTASAAVEGPVRVSANGTLDLDGHNDTIAALNGEGSVDLGSGGVLIVSHATQSSQFAGVISGAGQVTKDGPVSLRLTGHNTFTGNLTLNAGTFSMGSTGALESDVMVNGTASIYGIGPLGDLTANGGRVDPGFNFEGTGVLEPHNLTLTAGAQARFSLFAQPGSGESHDQLRVHGTVTLGNATLLIEPFDSFVPFNGTLTLIDNDGVDPVAGTFLNLPEGQTFKAGKHLFRITYHGGSGANDVVLTSLITEYHLSEGATGGFFDTDLLIANPQNVMAPVSIKYLKKDGGVVVDQTQLEPYSRRTIRVDDIAELENTEVSMIVESLDSVPLVVERTMRWDTSGYGAHTEKAVGGPARSWFFAEGAQGFFSTYLLLANPNDAENMATVRYLRENNPPITRTYPLAPNSRFTIGAGDDPELVNQSFGMIVYFTLPGVAERAMYFGQDPLWKAGHESAGVPFAAREWFLAEGATGSFFETFLLIANPNEDAASVDVTFLPDTGTPITKTKTVEANSRLTINIEAEDPALANAAVATRFTSTLPIVVERAQYWPDPAPVWHEAHNSFGVTEAAPLWGLAEGRVGGPEGYQTYILIANPGNAATDVTLRFLREGKPSFTKTFTVQATSRYNVTTGPGSLVPELVDERFGVRVESTSPNLPIVVERAMYSNAGGVVWSAGTNATATRLP